jgi:hypothetical protein
MEQSTVKWRNFVNCQVCGSGGAYCFPQNFICTECWSADASKRGYTGSVQNDVKFLKGHVPRQKFTPFKKADTVGFLKTWQHLVLDIAITLMFLFAIVAQEYRIAKLEFRTQVLIDAAAILLEDKLARDGER